MNPSDAKPARCRLGALMMKGLDSYAHIEGSNDPMAETGPRLYASLLRRYQALVGDGVLYVGVAVCLLVLLPELLDPSPAVIRWFLVCVAAFLLLYEPVLVWRRGGTLGHRRQRLRVVRADSGLPCGFGRALGRFLLKDLLGLFSFVFMLVTRRHQALHDLAFGTVVVVENPAESTWLDLAVERAPLADPGLPSRRRRAVVIVAYSLTWGVVSALLSVTFVSQECLDHNRCSAGEALILDGTGLLWILGTGVLLILGWRGRLFGCRRRRPSAPSPHVAA